MTNDKLGLGSLGLGLNDFSLDTVVQLGQPPRRIDLLTASDGVEFDACFTRHKQVWLSGVPLHIIALEDFKANKLASGRLKDLESLGLPKAADADGTPD